MSRKKSDSAITAKRQREQKKLMIDQLRKVPIVQVACEKIGVSRATYYRWLDDDATFATQTEEAIREGTSFINDMAESQLIGAIKDQNFAAISFWLRNRHKAYTNKVEVTTTSKQEITDEERQKLEQAFERLRLTQPNATNYAEANPGPGDTEPDPSKSIGTPGDGESLT